MILIFKFRPANEDELGMCAQEMVSASPLETQLSMYVCVNYIKQEKKLRIMVGRPNYNSRNLEAATIVISAGIFIDETDGGMGPLRSVSATYQKYRKAYTCKR